MSDQSVDRRPAGRRSLLLLAAVLAIAGGLAAWKFAAVRKAEAAAAIHYEPAEIVTSAIAAEREYRDRTTAIGTVTATRSVRLRNELPGTVRVVGLSPGRIVETGTVLVALDVSVEEAELEALQAQARLAEATLARVARLRERQAVSAIELDNARAERDVALAQIARTRAIIDRKTIRAPFRARVGIADVHPGQFLEIGTLLTTLQGIDDAAHIDFAVAQSVAARLRAGDMVEVITDGDEEPAVPARIVAVDALVDPATRNARVRARIGAAGTALAPGVAHFQGTAGTAPSPVASLSPGASVRVRIPVGDPRLVVAVPVSALRKGPDGDHLFVLEHAEDGRLRARLRPVRAGPVRGQEVMILAGLEPGEEVAATGSFKLRAGALVQVAGGMGSTDALSATGGDR
jgi:membrane fusion protein (multidrug efflux system)